jgi:hypothetical protein
MKKMSEVIEGLKRDLRMKLRRQEEMWKKTRAELLALGVDVTEEFGPTPLEEAIAEAEEEKKAKKR